MVRMADRDGEGISGIVAQRIGIRKQHADHHSDLWFLTVACPDNGLFHQIGCILRHGDSGFGRYQEGHPARLPELYRRGRVTIDESGFHGSLLRPIALDDGGKPVVDRDQPRPQRVTLARLQRTAGDRRESASLNLDQAPARAAEPRVDAENANRRDAHVPVDSPASGRSLAGLYANPTFSGAIGGPWEQPAAGNPPP